MTSAREPHDPEKTLYYFLGIDNARFKRVVEPGDQLILNVTAGRNMRGVWKFDARAEVDGVLAAEAKLMCSVTHSAAERCDDGGRAAEHYPRASIAST